MTPVEHYQATHKTVDTEKIEIVINSIRDYIHDEYHSYDATSYYVGKLITLRQLRFISNDEYLELDAQLDKLYVDND